MKKLLINLQADPPSKEDISAQAGYENKLFIRTIIAAVIILNLVFVLSMSRVFPPVLFLIALPVVCVSAAVFLLSQNINLSAIDAKQCVVVKEWMARNHLIATYCEKVFLQRRELICDEFRAFDALMQPEERIMGKNFLYNYHPTTKPDLP